MHVQIPVQTPSENYTNMRNTKVLEGQRVHRLCT